MIAYLLEYNRYMNILGIFIILIIAWLFSTHRSKINYKTIASGLLMQFALAFFILKTELGLSIFQTISQGVGQLYHFALTGVQFVFGSLTDISGPWGLVFAVRVLPIIIFFGAFMSLLFHLGIIQRVVYVLSLLVRPVLGTSGTETLCAIANSFLGQTEAPLLIRHYLGNVTRSEMMVVMTSGFATLSGAILAVYSAMGVPTVHLLAASVMAIPASIIMAKLLYPETEEIVEQKDFAKSAKSQSKNILDAIASGTSDGLFLALNVGAMLISFLGLIALLNALLGAVSTVITMLAVFVGSSFVCPEFSLNLLFGYLGAPFAWLLGFSGVEATQVAQLLGIKLTVNEFIAFDTMLKMNLSERTISIITYALASFANFSCIGIQIGGIGSLVPSKKEWLSQLGLRALMAATLANLLSAMVAGLLL